MLNFEYICLTENKPIALMSFREHLTIIAIGLRSNFTTPYLIGS